MEVCLRALDKVQPATDLEWAEAHAVEMRRGGLMSTVTSADMVRGAKEEPDYVVEEPPGKWRLTRPLDVLLAKWEERCKRAAVKRESRAEADRVAAIAEIQAATGDQLRAALVRCVKIGATDYEMERAVEAMLSEVE